MEKHGAWGGKSGMLLLQIFRFRFLHLHLFVYFLSYSLCHIYPSNQPMAVFNGLTLMAYHFLSSKFYILTVSLSVEMAVVVVLVSPRVAVPT